MFDTTVGGQTVNGGDDFVFSTNGPLSGVTHTAGTTDVVVPVAGTYQVCYGVSYTAGAGASIAVSVDGAPEASTNLLLQNATDTVTGVALLTLAANQTLTLTNNSGVAITTVAAPDVGAQFDVTLYS